MSADSERLPPPNEPGAFESLCLDLWRDVWDGPNVQKSGCSGYAMQRIGQVPPPFRTATPPDFRTSTPETLADEPAKDKLAKSARVACAGYGATTALMMIEAWKRLAPSGGELDMYMLPAEGLGRRELVLLAGWTFGCYTPTYGTGCRMGESADGRMSVAT